MSLTRRHTAQTAEDANEQYEEFRFRAGCHYPGLRELLTILPAREMRSVRRFSTNGQYFIYGKKILWEDYVHTLIHRLCGHVPMPEGRYPSVWNLASDMAAEYIRTLMFPDPKGERIRQDVQAVLTDGGDPWKAEDLYRPLMNLYGDELEELAWGFTRDDHSWWGKTLPEKEGGESGEEVSENGAGEDDTPGNPSAQRQGADTVPGSFVTDTGDQVLDVLHREDRSRDAAVREKELRRNHESERDDRALDSQVHEMLVKMWAPLLEALTSGESESGRWGLTPGSTEERAVLRERNRLDFTRYLRNFSVFGEEMMLDEDSFDQIPYYYGLQMYGNLPMIEPLEYADCYRVEDLVIAIDTSGSCSVDLVQEFLGEIRHILMDHDAFFRRMNVHIVQCDAYVRDHVVIHSREDWDRYSREINIRGRRGTDFRPVFRMAEQMVKDGEFRKLKGLFYFTDGEGIYPEWTPEFETAFIYSTAEALTRPGIPGWVTRLCMDLPDAY